MGVGEWFAGSAKAGPLAFWTENKCLLLCQDLFEDRSSGAKYMVPVPKKLHHTVPRFYLRAWSNNDQIYCLQNGCIFPSNIRNVGAENYFYRLQKLTSEDLTFIRRLFVERSDEATQNVLNELINAFTLPHEMEQQILQAGQPSAAIDRLIVEMNENLHTSIEDQFQPFLTAMRSGDCSFLKDSQQAAIFFSALTVQFSRTNNLHRFRAVSAGKDFERYSRLGNLLAHIVSLLAGRSLFVDRDHLSLMLIDNESDVPFVTSDQPIINMAINPRELSTPKRFELYYPLSPRKAMMLLEPESAFVPSCTNITSVEAHLFNLRLAAHAHKQLLAALPGELEIVRDELTAYLSCFPSLPSEF